MAKPKNPVRAARQAGREQIRAAKQQIKSYKDNKKVEAKLSRIDARISKKLDKIEKKLPPSQLMVGKDAGRVTGEAKPIGFKSVADKYKLQAPAPKSAPKSAPKAGGSKGGTSKKSSGSTDTKTNKKDLPDIKLSEYTELQKQYDEKKRKEARTPAEIAEQKRIAAIEAYTLFQNNREKARLKRLEKERLEKLAGEQSKKSGAGNSGSSSSSKPTFDMRFLDMGPKYKKGGSVKKYQAGGGNTVKPPRSIRGPKQSPSDMRQPYGPSQKPVGPGNTAKTPKPYRKGTPTMQPPMKKGGSVKKYQTGGAYTSSTAPAKANKLGTSRYQPKSSGPAPVTKPVPKRSAIDVNEPFFKRNQPARPQPARPSTQQGVRPASRQQTVKSKK